MSGLVAGFSLKNPLHPEFSFQTKSGRPLFISQLVFKEQKAPCLTSALDYTLQQFPSSRQLHSEGSGKHLQYQWCASAGAMALHLHLQHASLLAVGCYDGSVAVFDVRAKRQLLHSSSSAAGGHVQPVWGVVWRPAEPGAPSAFYSLSSDGRLLLWTMAATELTCQVAHRIARHLLSRLPVDIDGFICVKEMHATCQSSFSAHYSRAIHLSTLQLSEGSSSHLWPPSTVTVLMLARSRRRLCS